MVDGGMAALAVVVTIAHCRAVTALLPDGPDPCQGKRRTVGAEYVPGQAVGGALLVHS